jgi:type III secretion protein J
VSRFTLGPARTLLAVAAFCVVGCSVPVATELDERSANHIVTALSEAGIAAEKQSDPNEPDHFMIVVPHDEAANAVTVLGAEGLPARETKGLAESLDSNSLVPSRTAEQAKLLAGPSGELERSLEGIDGVLSARVHLAVTKRDPLAPENEPPPPSASVLIRRRPGTPPVTDSDVQRLVAFGVPGLAQERVAVVNVEVKANAPRATLVPLGPLSATPGTARTIRAGVALMLVFNVAFVALLVGLWTRLRKLRAATGTTARVRESR